MTDDEIRTEFENWKSTLPSCPMYRKIPATLLDAYIAAARKIEERLETQRKWHDREISILKQDKEEFRRALVKTEFLSRDLKRRIRKLEKALHVIPRAATKVLAEGEK